MHADGLGDAGRHVCGDRGVSVVQQVVHAGLGDAGDPGQCSHAERASGCSLHELAQEVAVGQVQAVVSHVISVHPRSWMWIAKHIA